MKQSNLLKLGSLILLIFLFSACNNAMNKPVTESLTVEEVKSCNSKHEDFTNIYELIDYQRKKLSIAELSYFTELTYQDVYDLITAQQKNKTKWLEEAEEEWSKSQVQTRNEILSLLKDWKKKYDDYHAMHKITIEPIQYSWETDRFEINTYPTVTIRIKSTCGAIERLHAVIAIENKVIDNMHNILNHYYSMGLGGHNDVKVENFSNEVVLPPMKFGWLGEDFNEDDFKNMTTDQLKEKYKFDYRICSIAFTKEAIAAKKKALPIPNCIEEAWKDFDENITYENTSNQNFEINQISKELLDKEYQPLHEYQAEYLIKKTKALNESAYCFIHKN